MASILSWGGGNEKTVKTNAVSDQKSMTTAIEGDVGSSIGQGASVASGGGTSITTGASAPVTVSTTGLSGDEIKGLMDTVFVNQAGEREALGGLASALSSGLQSQAQSLGTALSATKAPEQTMVSTFLPYALVGVLLYFLLRR